MIFCSTTFFYYFQVEYILEVQTCKQNFSQWCFCISVFNRTVYKFWLKSKTFSLSLGLNYKNNYQTLLERLLFFLQVFVTRMDISYFRDQRKRASVFDCVKYDVVIQTSSPFCITFLLMKQHTTVESLTFVLSKRNTT